MKLKTTQYRKYTEDEESIRNDDVFKIVFGSNERSQYLKELLESILQKRITNIVIRNDVALNKGSCRQQVNEAGYFSRNRQ